MKLLLQQVAILAEGNISDKGVVGKIINWALELLFGQDYETNAMQIIGVPVGIVMSLIGIIMFATGGYKMKKNQKEEAQRDFIIGGCLLGTGVLLVVLIVAFADSVKNI